MMLAAKRHCLLWPSCVGVLQQLMLILMVMVMLSFMSMLRLICELLIEFDQSVPSPRSVMPLAMFLT